MRQGLSADGGFTLDHLLKAEDVPEWRSEEFASLEAARQEADFVVVGVHWGVEDSHNITQAQRTLAQSLADWARM